MEKCGLVEENYTKQAVHGWVWHLGQLAISYLLIYILAIKNDQQEITGICSVFFPSSVTRPSSVIWGKRLKMHGFKQPILASYRPRYKSCWCHPFVSEPPVFISFKILPVQPCSLVVFEKRGQAQGVNLTGKAWTYMSTWNSIHTSNFLMTPFAVLKNSRKRMTTLKNKLKEGYLCVHSNSETHLALA